MPLTIIPDTDKPLPDSFEAEEPKTFKKKVQVATATAKVLDDAGAEIPVSSQEKVEAEELFNAFTNPQDSKTSVPGVNKSLSTPATVQHLYAMLSDYDHLVVQEAVQLRRFVTNKLIEDTGLADPRHRLKALELLGKISDVGLFTDKTIVLTKDATSEELEAKIKSKLFKILGTEKTVLDVDEEMGTITDDDLKEDS
tara:strand:- start:645 stop:1235 length:591 start_codon:yes stop_codon:yes gene_type:complete